MPREIKGWKLHAKVSDAFESYKEEKLLKGLYDEQDIKIHRMVNQYGNPYDVFYIKEGAVEKGNLVAMFGSYMTFEDKETKQLSGDRIRILEREVNK